MALGDPDPGSTTMLYEGRITLLSFIITTAFEARGLETSERDI
jgi:hypothetical protein